MPNIEQLNDKLDDISKNFIHRNTPDPTRGFDSVTQLCQEVENAKSILLALDSSVNTRSGLSEYWLRIFNDLTSYCEDWPLRKDDTDNTLEFVNALNTFNPDLIERFDTFTQTQRTRLLSIAMRARQATLNPVVTDVIDKYGSTMTLSI